MVAMDECAITVKQIIYTGISNEWQSASVLCICVHHCVHSAFVKRLVNSDCVPHTVFLSENYQFAIDLSARDDIFCLCLWFVHHFVAYR